jgi:hypothetical protein
MSNTREIYISQAFGEVAQLTQLIEVSATRDSDNADGSTTIEILKDLIVNQEDTPAGRGDANEACEKLYALRAAAELLIVALRGV